MNDSIIATLNQLICTFYVLAILNINEILYLMFSVKYDKEYFFQSK